MVGDAARAGTGADERTVDRADPDPAPATSRLAPLDGSRAAFLALVLGHHMVWAAPDRAVDWVPGAWAGLDGFLVLSGFLIAGGLLRGLDTGGRVSLGPFLLRRLVRLYPAMAVALGAMTASALLVDGRTWAQTFPSLRAGALYLMNRMFGRHGMDLFDPDGPSPLPQFTHLWSLGVEFQFYVAVAVLFAVAGALRFRPRTVAAVIVAVMVAASLHRSRVWREDGFPAAYVFTETRVDAILWGVLVALAMHHGRLSARHRGVLRILMIPVAVVLLWIYATQDPRTDLVYDLLMPVSGLANAIFLAWILLDGPNPVTRVLGSRILAGLGVRSYSMYLYHYPVFFLAGSQLPSSSPWVRMAVALCATVVLGDLSYRFVERPVLDRWARVRRARAAEARLPG